MFIKVLIFQLLIASSLCRDLPSYLLDLRCSMKTDFEECFKKNGNLAIPIVAKGDPDYGIPKLNPLEIPFFQLISEPNLKMNVTDVKVSGLENFQIDSSRLNMDNHIATITFKGPKVTLDGQYVVDGKVMILPIKGSGHFTIVLDDGTYKITAPNEVVEKDGEKYMKASEYLLDYSFGKVTFNFENLFDGDKTLGDEMNKFLNDNWDVLVVEIGPGVAKAISEYIEDVFDKFAESIPFQKFFID